MSSPAYDLVVIGSGPAGQKGAIAAAKLGKRVAVIDRKEMVGGVCLHTGTIPSKTLREAILYLTGFSEKSFYGRDYTLSKRGHGRGSRVPRAEGDGAARWRSSARSSRATASRRCTARARFVDAAHARDRERGRERLDGERRADPDRVRHASRAQRRRSPSTASGSSTRTSSSQGKSLPKNVIVVGAGVIGLEYASMLAALNIKVDGHRGAPDDPRLRRPRDDRGPHLLHAPARRDLPARREGRLGRLRREAARRRLPRERQGGPRRLRCSTPSGRQTNADLLNLAGGRPRRRTRAAGSPSTSSSRPPSRTSTPPATSSASRRWRRRRWSRDASRAATCSARSARAARTRSRTASTRSRRSRWSARPSRS